MLIFCFLFLLSLPITKSFKYFRAYHLQSGEILLITEEGIKKLNLNTQIYSTIYEESLFSTKNDIQYISFAQSLYDEGEYLFCRIKQYIYIISNSSNNLINTFHQDKMFLSIASLIPYENKNHEKLLILCYINYQKELELEIYSNLNDDINLRNHFTKTIEYKDGKIDNSLDYGISCELMKFSGDENDLLICFIEGDSQILNGLVFDPENECSYKYLITYEEEPINSAYLIKSAVSFDKNNCLICYEIKSFFVKSYSCISFNSVYTKWSEPFEFSIIANNDEYDEYDFEVYYIKKRDEYFFYLPKNEFNYTIFKLDKNFIIKESNDNGKCYLTYGINQYNEKNSFMIVYDKNNNKYISLYSYI